MIYTFITEQCPDLPVTTCCRVLKVSTSGFYQRLKQPVTDTELAEAYAANDVHDIWAGSRQSYGSPRVRQELRLGRGSTAENPSPFTLARPAPHTMVDSVAERIVEARSLHGTRRADLAGPVDADPVTREEL